MFDLLPPQDVGDPKAFLSAMIALFAEYPAEVGERAVYEIPKRSDRPTMAIARRMLEELYEPVDSQIQRDRMARALPRPSRQRTPQEQEFISAQVAAWRKSRTGA